MDTQINDRLVGKLKSLTETLWSGAADWPSIVEWLDNFADSSDQNERLHALYLLSQFMYFGSRELRELLKALYRDLYRYPVVESIRRANNNSTDCSFINQQFQHQLAATRFLGVGNPSESGSHLLYYFRQENRLPRNLFLNSHQLFSRSSDKGKVSIRDSSIVHYVFVDDFCGSGTQAVDYSEELVERLKSLSPEATVSYYSLFATAHGMEHARANTAFDAIDTVYELDDTFRCFGERSRYFSDDDLPISKDIAAAVASSYGEKLWPGEPLGFKDGQLLLGFFHNVPDNTLPIIWAESSGSPKWKPIFRRYPKIEALFAR